MVFLVRALLVLAAAAALLGAAGPAEAGDKLMTGGVVVNALTGQPLAGVTVAVFDDKGAVVGTDVTDDQGRWALETTWGICHLKEPPGGRGLFSSIVGVVSWPVRTTARVVGRPVKSAIKSAARAAGGAAVAGATVAAASGAGAVAIAAAGAAGKTVGTYGVEKVVGDPDEDIQEDARRQASAQVRVRVWQTGFKDYSGMAGINLLDTVSDDDSKEVSLAVTDTVKLAPGDSTLASRAPREVGIFRNVTANPAIVVAGSKVKLEMDIALPQIDEGWIWVIGKNLTTGQDLILRNAGGDRWDGVVDIPAKGPFRDHKLAFVAYRTRDAKGERDRKIESQIDKQGGWDPEKPFPVDPAILASRNRGYAVITVSKP